MYSDLEALTPEQYMKVITRKLTDIKAVQSPEQRSFFIQILENAYRFTLGSFAGGKYIHLYSICVKQPSEGKKYLNIFLKNSFHLLHSYFTWIENVFFFHKRYNNL